MRRWNTLRYASLLSILSLCLAAGCNNESGGDGVSADNNAGAGTGTAGGAAPGGTAPGGSDAGTPNP